MHVSMSVGKRSQDNWKTVSVKVPEQGVRWQELWLGLRRVGPIPCIPKGNLSALPPAKPVPVFPI